MTRIFAWPMTTCRMATTMPCVDPSQCTLTRCLWLEQGCPCASVPKEPIPVPEVSDSDWGAFEEAQHGH